MVGGSVFSRQPTGRANTSPSASVPMIWTTPTGGRTPRPAARCPRPLLIMPASLSSRSTCLRSALRLSARRKAWAISRVPTRPGLSVMKARISSRDGKGAAFLRLLGNSQRSVGGGGDGALACRRLLGSGFLARGFLSGAGSPATGFFAGVLPASLRRLGGEQLEGAL